MTAEVLAAAIDIRRWLAEDAQRPLADRLDRDTLIARKIPAVKAEPKVLAWWREIGAQASRGEQVVRLRRIATGFLFVIGIVLGAAAAGVALAYEGRHPVNLLALLGVLLGIPTLLLLVTLVLLPGRGPGLGPAQEFLGGLNLSRWVGVWLERYAGLGIFADFSSVHGTGRFARWQLTVFSQWLTVGFFVGVLSATWFSLMLTDLAFGWSTTLDLQAVQLHTWVSALSAPWRDWFPAAAPSLDLVETSRFFRLQTDAVTPARAARLGEWWPFVLMIIAVYGLLPRLALLGFAGWRLRAASSSALLDNAEVTALLDRLNVPQVEFQAHEIAAGDDDAAQAVEPPPDVTDARAAVLIWNAALDPSAAQHWLVDRFQAGGSRVESLGTVQDRESMHVAIAELADKVDRVFVFTKGWEPPLLEFSDVLQDLRAVLGAQASLVVVPVDVQGRSVLASARQVWAQALARLGDPKLYVVSADEAAPS